MKSSNPAERPRVTVVGGGIAGMTAALQLVRRGYPVTIYENSQVMGGNVGAYPRNPHADEPDEEPWYDVYPHMFAAFYRNFWRLVEDDLGLSRKVAFEARSQVQVLDRGGEYTKMRDVESLQGIWENLFGGPQPPADMVVSMYALLDLICRPIRRGEVLSSYSVAGFLSSRPYMTERAAQLHDYLLVVVWSAHAYGISAASYRDFFRFGLRESAPLNYLLREDAYHGLVRPFEEALERSGRIRLLRNRRITKVILDDDGRVRELMVQETRLDPNSGETVVVTGKPAEPVEIDGPVVLAVNPTVMAHLAQLGDPAYIPSPDHRDDGRRMVEFVPELSQARQARAEPIAVLNLHFEEKIPDIPAGHVSLGGSPMHLSVLDVSQLWASLHGDDQPTVLTVSASNYYGLPSNATTVEGEHADIVAMVEELRRYLPQTAEYAIDWGRSEFHTNLGETLFVNDVASEVWRPPTHDPRLPDLYLAGDYCLNGVGMATVEAAVVTGLDAARRLHEHASNGPPADPVTVIEHEAHPDFAVHLMKLALMQWAYPCTWWSTVTDIVSEMTDPNASDDWRRDWLSLWSLPGHYAMDLLETSTGLGMSLWDEFFARRSTCARTPNNPNGAGS